MVSIDGNNTGYRALWRSQTGLSLVEVMVALVVVVTGMTALVHMFPQGLSTGRHALERTQATLLGKGKLEALRLEGFERLALPQRFPSTAEPFSQGPDQEAVGPFRWQAEVKLLADDLLELHLRVVWPWPRQTYQVNFATYISKH